MLGVALQMSGDLDAANDRVRQLEQADDAAALLVGADEVHHVELGLAEEDVGALLLEHHDRAQQDADRGRGHSAVLLEERLARLGVEGHGTVDLGSRLGGLGKADPEVEAVGRADVLVKGGPDRAACSPAQASR